MQKPAEKTTQRSYSNVIQKDNFPTKEQAIVLVSIEGSTFKNYTHTIEKLVDPNNIRFVSRISKNRICMYLSSTEIVNRLTENKTRVNIGNSVLEIRLLIYKH